MRRPTRKVFAESLIQEAREDDRTSSPSPPPCRRGTGLDLFGEVLPVKRPSMSASPSSMRVTFAAGLGDRRLQAVLRRSIRPSCSAPTTRSCTTSRSRSCRCVSQSTAPAWSAPTAPPIAGSFDVAYLWRACRALSSWRRPTRLELSPHGAPPRQPSTTARSPSAIRAARASASTCPERGSVSRNRQGPHCPGRQQGGAICPSAHGYRIALLAAEELGAAGLSHNRGRCPLRQAARRAI